MSERTFNNRILNPQTYDRKIDPTATVTDNSKALRRALEEKGQRGILFLGAGEIGAGTRAFFHAPDVYSSREDLLHQEGLERFTTYNTPSSEIARDVSSLIDRDTRIMVNAEWDDFRGQVNPKTAGVRRFGRDMQGRGATIKETRWQMHAKTALKRIDGIQTLYIGTGNFTPGMLQSHELANELGQIYQSQPGSIREKASITNDRGRLTAHTVFNQIGDQARALALKARETQSSTVPNFAEEHLPTALKNRVQDHQEALVQVNFALITQDRKYIDEYIDIYDDIADNDLLDRNYDNFIVGGPGGDSRQKYVDLIRGAKESIDVVSPYADDPAIAQELVKKAKELKDSGENSRVRMVTLPFSSAFKKGTGGDLQGRLQFVSQMHRAGAKVYMADHSTRVMIHGKVLSIDDVMTIMGSHNKTNKAADRSVELSAIVGEEQVGLDEARQLADNVDEQLNTLIDSGAIKEVTSEDRGRWSVVKLREQIAGALLQEKGMHNEQYVQAIASEYSGFTISASAGASYHFGRAIHATHMNQAGYMRLAETVPAMGVAESTMRSVSMLKHGREPSNWELTTARNFDTSLNTPGLGQWLNQKLFLPMGWGRVYKDELGAIPSIAGLAGKILDEGYLYYAQTMPDYITLGQDYGQGVGYGSYEGEQGLFEKLFGSAAKYGIASAQALGLYMAITQPIDMLKASMNKNFLEGSMRSIFRARPEMDMIAGLDGMRATTLMTFNQHFGLDMLDSAVLDGFAYSDDTLRAIGKAAASIQTPALSGYFFGGLADSVSQPGGIAAAVMLHKYNLEQATGMTRSQKAFFNSDWSSPQARRLALRSMFTELNFIQRNRGAKILEKVFKPFLEDFVNPYDVSAGQRMTNPVTGATVNAFHEYNRRVQALIDIVAAPPDIVITRARGQSLTFHYFDLKNADGGDVNLYATSKVARRKLIEQMEQRGVLNTVGPFPQADGNISVHRFNVDEVTSAFVNERAVRDVGSFSQYMEYTTKELGKVNKALEHIDDQVSDVTARLNRAKSASASHPEMYGKISAKYTKELEDLEIQRVLLQHRNNSYMSQLGRAASQMDFSLIHMGARYKTNIARHVQGVLDMTPLWPTQWGFISKSLVNTSDTLMIGQLFSFYRSAQLIEDAITGDNGLKRLLYAADQISIDDARIIAANKERVLHLKAQQAALDDDMLGGTVTSNMYDDVLEARSKMQREIDDLTRQSARLARTAGGLQKVFAQKYKSIDSFVEGTFERLAEGIKRSQEWTRKVGKVTRQFRKFEETVVGFKGDPDNVRGKIVYTAESSDEIVKGARIVEDLGEGRVLVEAKGKNISQSMDELIDAASSYDDMLKTSKNIGGELPDELLSRAVAHNKSLNVADDVSKIARGASKNLIAETFVGKANWMGAAMLFSVIALNNIAQSTSGASIVDQLAMTIAGSDYKIAVESRGNKILPLSEVMANMTGMDPTLSHTIVEGGTIAAAIYLGNKIAVSQSHMGFVPYTFTQKHVRGLIDEGSHGLFKVVDNTFVRVTGAKGATDSAAVMKAIFEGKEHGAEFVIKSLQKETNKHLKVVALTSGNFETKPFMQLVATEIPVKTLVFATLGLLALGSVRNTLSSFINSMTDGEEAMTGFIHMVGMTAAFGGLGVGAQIAASKGRLGGLMVTPKSAIKGLKGGARIAAKLNNLSTRTVMRSPMLGLAIGGIIGVGLDLYRMTKLDMFDNTPGGSLDPMAGMLMGGIAAGALLKSPAGLLVGAAAGMLFAKTLNWAGIKFLRTSQRGQVADQDQLRMVSQLGLFSSTVLQDETIRRDHFNLAMAAYAGHLGKGQDIISKQFNDLGEDVRVVPRQSPLPFLQFFTAERIKHKGGLGEGWATKSAQPGTATTYSLGVQTGPLFGLSLSIELPVMYTPKQGWNSLSYNPDHNLLDLFEFTGRIGAYSALFLGGGEQITMGLSHIFRSLGVQDAAEGLLEASKVLGGSHRFIFNATARVNDLATTTLVRTGLGLYGTDAMLVYNRLMQHSAYSEDVIRVALTNTSIKELKLTNSLFAQQVTKARREFNAMVSGTHESGEIIGQRLGKASLAKTAGKMSHFMIGMLVGSAVAWAGFKAYEITTRGRVTNDVAELIAEQTQREDEWEKHALKAGFFGAGVGGLNVAIKSVRATDFVDEATGDIAKTIYTADWGAGLRQISRDSKGLDRIAYEAAAMVHGFSRESKKVAASLIDSKAYKILSKAKLVKPLLTIGAFTALAFTQYVRIDSDFGLIKYMDQNIVYDTKGKPTYDGFGVVYEENRMHQAAVASGLSLAYGIPAYYVMRPHATLKGSIISFVEDYTLGKKIGNAKHLILQAGVDPSNANTMGANLIYRASHRSPGFRKFGRDTEVLTLFESMQRYKSQLTPETLKALNATKGITPDKKILRLIEFLGEEEVENITMLHRALQGGQDIDDIVLSGKRSAEVVYNSGLSKLRSVMEGTAVTEATAEGYRTVQGGVKETAKEAAERVNKEMFDAVNILARQRVVRKFGAKVAGVFAVAALTKMVGKWFFSMGGPAGGEPGKQSYLDRIFDKARAKGMYGDSSEAGFGDRSLMVMADVLRVFLGRDRIDLTLIDHFNKNAQQLKGEKLTGAPQYGTLGQYREIMKNRSAIENLLVIDQTNSYFATLDFGGKTIRAGDRGHYTSTYFQLQGAGHDISTAGYSMAAKFIFSQYIGGKGQLSRNIDAAIGQFNPTRYDAENVDNVSMLLRNASAMTHALKKSRKIKRISGETEAMLYGDAITNAIIKARYAEIGHIAQQPITSLFTNMFFEGLDKARLQGGQEAYEKFLLGVAKNDRGLEGGPNFMQMFADIMDRGAFGNFFGAARIKNVIMFNGFGKGQKNKNQKNVQDIAGIWHDTSSLSVQAEERKQSTPELFKWYRDDVLNPLTSTGIMTFMPKPVMAAAALAAGVTTTAWIVQMAARFMQVKDWESGWEETSKVWSGKAGPTIEVEVSGNSFSASRAHTRKGAQIMTQEAQVASRTAAETTQAIAPAEQVDKSLARGTKAGEKGTKYTMTRTFSNNQAYRVTLSEFVEDISSGDAQTLEEGRRALLRKGVTHRDYFLNMVETYGQSLKKMFLIVDDADQVLDITVATAGKATGAKVHKAILDDMNNITNSARSSVYDFLNEGGEIAQKTLDRTKEAIKEQLTNVKESGVLDKFVDKFFNEELLLEKHTIWAMKDGVPTKVEVYMYELMGNRITANGTAVRGIDGDVDIFINGIGSEKRLEWFKTLKKRKKAWLENIVKKTVEKEVAGVKAGTLTSANAIDVQKLGKGVAAAEEEVRWVLQQVLRNIQADPQFADFLGTNAGLLDSVEDIAKSAAVKKAAHKIAKQGGKGAGSILTEMVEDALHYSVKAKAPASMMGKALMSGVFNAFSVISDSIYALDTYAAYARLGEAYTSHFATDVDRALAKRELGASIISSAIGTVVNFAAFKYMPLLGSKFMNTIGKHWGKALFGAMIGGPILAAGWKGFVRPILKGLGNFVEENKVIAAMGEFAANKGSVIDDVVGNIAAAPALGFGKIGQALGGEEGRKAGINFGAHGTGMALGAGILMVSVATLGVSIPLMAAGAIAAGAFLVGGIMGLTAPQFFTDMSTTMLRDIHKIPVIGEFLSAGIINPYQHSRDKLAHKGYAAMANSPFSVGYIGNIVNKKWLSVLSAHEDYSGGDMTSILFGKILDTSTNLNPAWRKNMASGLVGSPPSIVDEVHMRELKIRAQTYGDTVVGRYGWNEMVRISDANQRVKNQDKHIAQWRQKQRDYERFAIMSAMLRADNDISGTTSASVLASQQALNKVQELEQMNKDKEQPKEVSTITGANITDKNEIRDAQDTLNRESVALASNFGIDTTANTAKYSLEFTPDGANLWGGVKKEIDYDEDVYGAVKAGLGLTSPPLIEVQISQASHELVDTQSMITANNYKS